MDEYGGGKVHLKPCKHCGRSFVPESLAKHQPTCQNIQKKRKPFDASKQRATEDVSVRQIKQAQKKVVKPPRSHWKQQHEEFIRNIRAAKGAQVAIDRGDPLPPPPPPSSNPDYEQCPHCNRRFNSKAAERHIGFCKEQQKRMGAKREPSQQEKARAAARGFQAPRPVKKDPVPSGGGYSSGGGRGGYSGGSAMRTPPAAAGSRSETGRAPAGGGGYSSTSRGRGTTGATRGRPAPASQPTYQASDYADYDNYGGGYGGYDGGDSGRIGSGRALRTGRDARSYEEARRDTRGHNSVQTRTKGAKMRAGMQDSHLATTPKMSGYSQREAESGYYSNNSENDMIGHSNYSKNNMSAGGGGGAASKFCHECGSKYPLPSAKFCCECGIQRMAVR